MINNNREDYQYNSGDLVYIISPLTSQLRTNSRKVTIKYIGTIHMVQNTKALSYHSIILPLRFPISFTLHNTVHSYCL